VLGFGLKGISLLFIPAMIMGVLLLAQMNKCHALLNVTRAEKTSKTGERGVDRWGAFGLLCVLLFSRSFVFYGMNTFLPLYWINVFGRSETTANTALSIFLTAGAVSTLFGGRLADRFGLHSMIRVGFAVLLPAIALFAADPGVLPSTLLLIPISMGLYLPFSAMVVTGQRYLPNHIGLASGVTLGLVISVGGLAAPILGKLADLGGFHPVMHVLAGIAVIPALMAFFLPRANTETAAA
jgi:FSR family fosmidomycin resistance protein-like MFS transporter